MHKNAEGVEENVVRFYSTSSGASFDSLQPSSAFRVRSCRSFLDVQCIISQ